MSRSCAHRKREIDDGPSAGSITRALCPACALEMTRATPRTAGEILNAMNVPVFLIDSDGVLRGANRSAADLLNKALPDIENQMGGDAFECSYAKHAGGCGKTIHCKTCAIRNIVLDTLASGYGFDKVPAFQSIDTPAGPSITRFVITTEKVGEQVLLRIDGARKGFSA